MFNLGRINKLFVIYVDDTQLPSKLYNWQPFGVYFLQNDFSSYGIDWDGPVPAPSPDSVEVPETRCPINPEQIASMYPFYPPENAPVGDVIELFSRAVEHVNQLLNVPLSS